MAIRRERASVRAGILWAATQRVAGEHGFASRGAIASGFCVILVPQKTEGAGNAGCTTHPLPCVQNKKDARRPTQVRRNHSGTPCAMVLRLLRALLGVSGLLASVPPGF